MQLKKQRIAVIGGGVAGITAAHILQREHEVTLFEKNDYLGGHTNTVRIEDGPDAGCAVDTGFIVCNDRTYPLFHQLLKQLGVAVRWSDMSFSYYCLNTDFYYAGTDINGLFAQRKNIVAPRMWRILADIMRFSRRASSDLTRGALSSITLGEYIAEEGYRPEFVRDYLYPMGSAIWSAPREELASFPAEAFVAFFRNHGLLSFVNRPRWQTVVGGSSTYVSQFLKQWSGTVYIETPVCAVERGENDVTLYLEDGSSRIFDSVVLATHADQTLALLRDPSKEEQALLGAWRYEKNQTVLHTDTSVLPPNKNAWASWNYVREVESFDAEPASVTYYMNKLQGLRAQNEYCVTLNRREPIADAQVIREFLYTHPQYTIASLATQTPLRALQGTRHTYFCGSYHGYGFHEDAVRSAEHVANCFGLSLTTSSVSSEVSFSREVD